MSNGDKMNDKTSHQHRESPAVMETLETRELFSVYAIAWGGPTMTMSFATSLSSEIVSPRDPASGLPTGK
jgi:hypothetical protein